MNVRLGLFLPLGPHKPDGRQAAVLLGDRIVGTLTAEMENVGSTGYPDWVTARYVAAVVGHELIFPVKTSTAQARAHALSWAKKRVAEAMASG